MNIDLYVERMEDCVVIRLLDQMPNDYRSLSMCRTYGDVLCKRKLSVGDKYSVTIPDSRKVRKLK